MARRSCDYADRSRRRSSDSGKRNGAFFALVMKDYHYDDCGKRGAYGGREHHGRESAEEGGIEGGENAAGDIAGSPWGGVDHPPEQHARGGQAEGDRESIRAALVGREDEDD